MRFASLTGSCNLGKMIRQAKQSDAQGIVDIYNYYVINSIATFELEPLSAEIMATRIKTVQQASLPWIVLVDKQQRPLGYAYASQWHPRSAYSQSVEITIYLAPTATSQRFGTRLFEALLAELRSLDLHVVIGCISLPNAASVALHEKFGMTKVAHFSEVGHKFDNWIDVGYWQVIL